MLGHLASLPRFLKWRRGNVPCNSNISGRSNRSCNSGIATGPIPGPIAAFPVGPLLTTHRVSAGCPGARLSPVLRAALARYPTRNCRCGPCIVSLRCCAPAQGRRPLCAAPPYRRATAPRHSSFQSSGAARPRDARTRRGCPPLRCGAGGFAPQTPDAAWARLRPPLRTINRLAPINRASVGATGRLAPPGADGPPVGRRIRLRERLRRSPLRGPQESEAKSSAEAEKPRPEPKLKQKRKPRQNQKARSGSR